MYEHLRNLDDAMGMSNIGISVMVDNSTGKKAICKKLPPGDDNDREAAMMKKFEGHPHIVQLYQYNSSCKTSDEEDPYDELIVEYCTAGKLREVNTLGQLLFVYNERDVDLPELFIWEIFESLLSVLCFMHLGVRDASSLPIPEWDPVWHQDLHQANVFLSADPGTDAESSYPRAVVGDFGRAVLNSYDSNCVGCGSDKLNVARMMWAMCHRDRPTSQESVNIDQAEELGNPRTWVDHYSEELRQLATEYFGEIYDHDSTEVLPCLQNVIKTKDQLLASGKLKYEPLSLLV